MVLYVAASDDFFALVSHNLAMSDIGQLRVLGAAIRRRRIDQGVKTLRQMKELTGISTQFLSQIENAYVHPKRGYVVPSDELLERISRAIDMPLSRMHTIIGRFPEKPEMVSPVAAEIAEEYDRLPEYAQQIVLDAVQTAKSVVAKVEQNYTGLKSEKP